MCEVVEARLHSSGQGCCCGMLQLQYNACRVDEEWPMLPQQPEGQCTAAAAAAAERRRGVTW
jgi:hypothetical protein